LIELRFLDIKLSKENPKQEHVRWYRFYVVKTRTINVLSYMSIFIQGLLYYIINTKGFTESIGQKYYAIKSNPKIEWQTIFCFNQQLIIYRINSFLINLNIYVKLKGWLHFTAYKRNYTKKKKIKIININPVVDIGAIFHFLNCLQLKFLIIIWLQLSQLPTQILFCTLGVIRYQSISKTATYSCNVTNTCIYIYIYI